MKIREIMSKPVVTGRRTATIKETVKRMADKKIGGIVITEKKIPIGIFTRRDLLSALLSNIDLDKNTVESVMHTPVLPVSENDEFITAARQMRSMDMRRFIVIQEGGPLCGIVTDLDVVKSYTLTSLNHRSSMATISMGGLTATPSTPLRKIAKMMMEERRSCTVILKNRKPVGIINESLFVDLAAKFKDPLKFKAEDKMIKKFCGAQDTDSLRESVINMVKNDFRNIILSDDAGNFTGVVSMRELVTYIVQAQL